MRPENGVSRVDTGVPPAQGTKLGRGANFRCPMSDAPIPGDYIKAEGKAGRMGAQLMAIVAEGDRSRVYLAPTAEQEAAARKVVPEWKPEQSLPDDQRNFWAVLYGLTTWGDLFTSRQLVALTTFSDLVAKAVARIKQDIQGARVSSRPPEHDAGGTPALPRGSAWPEPKFASREPVSKSPPGTASHQDMTTPCWFYLHSMSVQRCGCHEIRC